MKYCKNCGTLLEDTHEHCIRCGTDVTIAENVSMYPIEVMETIEEENQRKKASGKIVAMIIGLVVVLVALVIAFLALGSNMKKPAPTKEANETKEVAPAAKTPEVTVQEESIEEENTEEEAAPASSSNRAVKDDEGKYYDYIEEKDDAGNVVFTALLPEDLTERELFKDYEVYSDRYPISLNYTASTKENDVRFTYLSARKLWYKLGETGKGRSNESDVSHYMTYFEYENPRSYLEPLLQQSYPGAKLELKNEYDVNEIAPAKLETLAKAKNKELFGDIGDYAYIGKGTTYANMDYESSAKVYEYEITLKDKDMLFCRYYVPSMAHNLTYANTNTNDRGNITEWYNFSIVCFETGNEDNFDDYEEDFNVFIANALPTDLFMYINEGYSKEIKKSSEDFEKAYEEQQEGKEIDQTVEPPKPLDKEKLEKLGKEYKPGTKLDDFDASVMDILRSGGVTAFKGSDLSVYGSDKTKVAFFDKAKNKVFISPGEDEFPGDSYEELTKSADATENTAEATDDTADAAQNTEAE